MSDEKKLSPEDVVEKKYPTTFHYSAHVIRKNHTRQEGALWALGVCDKQASELRIKIDELEKENERLTSLVNIKLTKVIESTDYLIKYIELNKVSVQMAKALMSARIRNITPLLKATINEALEAYNKLFPAE